MHGIKCDMANKFLPDSTQPIRLSLAVEYRNRLAHHAKRTGFDASAIVRQATIAHLDMLDAQEIATLNARNAERDAKRAYRKPIGLGITSAPRVDTVLEPAVKRCQKHFAMWAEYVEGADGPVEHEKRMDTVKADIGKRVDGDDVMPVLLAFDVFINGRKPSKAPATTEIVESVLKIMGGDV